MWVGELPMTIVGLFCNAVQAVCQIAFYGADTDFVLLGQCMFVDAIALV